MRKIEIDSGNLRIAEFMGYELDNSFPDKGKVYRLGRKIDLISDFKYHEDYAWLMPVVDKMESEQIGCIVSIVKNLVTVSNYTLKYNWYGGTTTESKILCIWHAVVQFAKVYNESKHTKI